MASKVYRLQNLLLLLIVILLTLNILLPARYTLQFVRIEPIAGRTIDIHDPAVVVKEHDQEELLADVDSEREMIQSYNDGGDYNDNERNPMAEEEEEEKIVSNQAWNSPDGYGWKPSRINKQRITAETHGQRRDHGYEVDNSLVEELNPKHNHKMLEAQQRRKRGEMRSVVVNNEEEEEYNDERDDDHPQGQSKVNLHDPAQRMAYYKMLRKRLVEKGQEQGHVGQSTKNNKLDGARRELVHAMWPRWHEKEREMNLEALDKYVTEDITPTAIEAELYQCSAALGVTEGALQRYDRDLKLTSMKLSAFISAIKSIVPDTFSSTFSSPCWFGNRVNTKASVLKITPRLIGENGRLELFPNQAVYLAQQTFGDSYPNKLFCLPRFFLAGFPKSATTTFADVLFAHPHISSAVIKECHWWTRAPIISPDSNLLQLNVLRYLMHFGHMAYYAQEQPSLLAMDGSQSTLWDSNFVFNGQDFCSTPAAISHVIPHAKFIVLMREPSERLYSYYLWSCSFSHGNNPKKWPEKIRQDPAGNFHSEVAQITEKFSSCLKSHSLYECANQFTFGSDTGISNLSCGHIGFRLVVSIYYIHIAKFLHFFPREQFLFLKMEDLSEESAEIAHNVAQFLDIMTYPPSVVSELFEKKHNNQKAKIESMHNETRQLLQEFFAPFNRLLADLLKDDRFLWGYS